MEHPLISVIIPVYNMEQYLARCLDSVLNNTYRNLEVICVDDGSRDQSLEILREYEEQDSRIVVIAKENGGVSSARNAGLDRMTGEFVTFLDSDDFIHPQYFALMLQAQTATDADFVIGQYRKVSENELPIEPEPLTLRREDIRCLDCRLLFRDIEARSLCTIRLIRAEHVNSLRFRQDLPNGEDTMFTAELWERHPEMKACVIPIPIYYYFIREQSASNTFAEENKLFLLRLFEQRSRLSPVNMTIYLDQIVRFSLSNRELALYIHPNRKLATKYSRLLRRQLGPILRTDVYSRKEKLGLCLFIFFPRLRWEYRCHRDPSLRRWKQVEKERRKKEKGTSKNRQ